MRIRQASLYVNDQAKALDFYTKTLGFVKKLDITSGNYRWLTVVAPDDQEGTQLVLSPNENPTAKSYQEGIFKQGMPASMFFVDDLPKKVQRLKKAGVSFTMEPTKVTGSTIAMLNDTCGNLIQLTQLDWK
ncbi:MAG TPA: VOC family protein [Candidatus Bathyarchaeia archaeon]|nr:VOC family protein [Candidatus Bathyarchaeia archaeon]